MRPKSLVWLVCTPLIALVLVMVLVAGAGYPPEGRAAHDPAWSAPTAEPPPIDYPGHAAHEPEAPPLEMQPVAARAPAPPGRWVGIVCGVGMLGLFGFLGLLALRGTADNVIRLRRASD